MKRKVISRILCLLHILGFGIFTAHAVSAATPIIVTTTGDLIAEDSQCSLREAIIAANTDAPVGGCPAGTGADTITFAPSLTEPATITLSLVGLGEDDSASGDLDIIGQLTITGWEEYEPFWMAMAASGYSTSVRMRISTFRVSQSRTVIRMSIGMAGGFNL